MIGATFEGDNIGVCRYICIILCMVIVVGHGVGDQVRSLYGFFFLKPIGV